MAELATLARPDVPQLAAWQSEVDEFLEKMQTWHTSDPNEVYREIAMMGTRLMQMRSQIVRMENRALQAFRTKEIDPILSHLKFQFEVHSRRLTSMQFDLDLSR